MKRNLSQSSRHLLRPDQSASDTRVMMLSPDRLGGQVGGMGRMAAYTAQALKKSRSPVQMTFVATRKTDLPILKHLSTGPALFEFLFRLVFQRTDLVHINVAPKGSTWRKAIFARLACAFAKPIVLHLHGAGYDQYFAAQSAKAQARIRAFFRSANAVIVLGDGWRDWALSGAGLGLEPAKVHVIDNGVPDPGLRARHENPVPRIVFVGLVGHRKGVDTLLEALALLPPSALWTCAICGNGEVETYRTMAKDRGLDLARVTFTGWQDETQVRAQMAASDIFVLPSRAENQPIAILEAMAIGLPVVATSVGDIPNQVIDAETGFVVAPDDPVALEGALAALIAAPERRKEMGDRGRQRFEDRYSSARNLEKTLLLYAALAS